MADNLIEQFFIDIELNTKGVGKQAKQIDKILDGLGVRAAKRERSRTTVTKSHKIKEERDFRKKERSLAQKALAQRLKEKKKAKTVATSLKKKSINEETLVAKALQKNEEKRLKRQIDLAKIRNKVESARIRQQVGSLTQGNSELQAMKGYYQKQASNKTVSNKPAASVAEHPEKIKNDKIKAEKAFREKESILAQKALADRLKSFKKEKAVLSGMKEKEISEYRTVQKAMDSLNKKRTDAATKREIDLAKISHNKNTKAAKEQQRLSSLQTKQHVQRMTQQDQEIQKMKEFYKEQSKAAERAAKRQKVIDNQLERIQGTAWYNKLKSTGGDTHGFKKN